LENLWEIKHIGGIRLGSFSNHVHESSKVIILVLWLKESRIVEGSVLEVENYKWLQSHHTCVVFEEIKNSKRECGKGKELYMVVTNESKKGLFLLLP
jgi:hypothetical protein